VDYVTVEARVQLDVGLQDFHLADVGVEQTADVHSQLVQSQVRSYLQRCLRFVYVEVVDHANCDRLDGEQ
jgi:hypothetical protein